MMVVLQTTSISKCQCYDVCTLSTMLTISLRKSMRTLKVMVIWLKRVGYIVKSVVTLSL